MKIIMYHYIEKESIDLPNLKYLHYEDFIKQLQYFEKYYGFVSKQSFFDSFKTGQVPEGVVLTFDDGLRCHYDIVYKTLKSRGLWGIFYVNSAPILHDKYLDVHITHILTALGNSEAVYSELLKLCENDLIDPIAVEEFDEYAYSSQIADEYSQKIKKILNYFIRLEFRPLVLDKLLSKFAPDKANNVAAFYLSDSQIQEMHRNGMIIGGHTVNHMLLSRLKYDEQEYEINQSISHVKCLTKDESPATFCIPYGGFKSFNQDTLKLLSAANVYYCMNVESRDVQEDDLLHKKLFLPRYDCNEFSYGQCRN